MGYFVKCFLCDDSGTKDVLSEYDIVYDFGYCPFGYSIGDIDTV
jgi:hypothetical protein